jgi:hypothetical protein
VAVQSNAYSTVQQQQQQQQQQQLYPYMNIHAYQVQRTYLQTTVRVFPNLDFTDEYSETFHFTHWL